MLNIAVLSLLTLTWIPANPSAADPPETTTVPSLIEVKRGHVPTFPRVFSGLISDADGNAIAGAVIEWGPLYPTDVPPEHTVSRDDGSFRLAVQKAGGHFRLGISAPHFGPVWYSSLVPGPESAPTKLNIRMQPETTLEISIVSEAGTPIPNLEIVPMTPTSGFESSFSHVQQPELIPGHRQATSCDDKGVCVLNQLLPAPPPLQIIADDDTKPQQEFKKRSNAEGWLSLRIDQQGQSIYEHQISSQEYFESNGHVHVVVPDASNPLVRATYNGTVLGQVDDANGDPVNQYTFTIRYKADAIAVNNPDGQFEWGKMLDPNRNVEIRIFAKGFAPSVSRISPTTGDATHYRIRLEPAPSAEFQLVDRQTEMPVAGASVVTGISKRDGWNYVEWNSLGSYADGHHGLESVLHVITDANGRITLPEGKAQATLIILTPGYARTIVIPEQRPEPDETGIVRIAIDPAATIHATRAPGSQIGREGTNIYLDQESSGGFSQMFHALQLNEQGECLIDSLAPGRYHVGLSHSNGNMSTACWLKTIELKSGEHRELPLCEMSGTLTVSGRTAPFTDVSLRRRPDIAGAENSPSVVTLAADISDIDGYFEINGLDAAVYDVKLGSLSNLGRISAHSAFKQPFALSLAADTHIDFITGTVEPPDSVLKTPAPQKR